MIGLGAIDLIMSWVTVSATDTPKKYLARPWRPRGNAPQSSHGISGFVLIAETLTFHMHDTLGINHQYIFFL